MFRNKIDETLDFIGGFKYEM